MKWREFLRGMGSILNIWPSTNYDDILEASRPENQLRDAWTAVGNALRDSMEKVKNERPEANP